MYRLLEVSFVVLSLVEEFVSAQQGYTAVPRWGQASVLVNDVFFVHGGRTDQFNSFAYSSAPVNNDVLYLPLNSSFNVSSPPWQRVLSCSDCASSQGPAVAWHTLTPFNAANLLLFGGDAGPNGPIAAPEEADSAALVNISNRSQPIWTLQAKSWANQPLRRIYHTACESGGQVFLIGGEKTDGSGNAFSEHYVYDPNSPTFTQLPTANGPPDLLGHASVMLPDRRLLVFGGYSPSKNTLLPFSTVWSLDTKGLNFTWTALDVSNANLPIPRRGFAAAVLEDSKIIVQGGADADMQNVFSDGWVLDTTEDPMTWSPIDALSQVGPRRDHFAVAVGPEVIFGFGYAQSAPANASLLLFDASKNEFLGMYTPPPDVVNPTSTTLPIPSGTSGSGPPSGTIGGSSGTHGSFPTSSGNPGGGGNGDGHDGDPSGKSGKSHTTAVALGIVCGVLGLVAGGAAAYYLSKRHPASGKFHRLGPSDDDDSPHMGPIIPVAGAVGAREKSLPVVQNVRQKLVGLVPGRTAPQQTIRRDILADEDTRVFEPSWYDVRREGSIGSCVSVGGGYVRPSLGDMVHGSLNSLKNVGGAMLAYASGNRRNKDVSEDSYATYWEKEPSYGYSDKTALISDLPSLNRAVSRPRGGGQESDGSQWTQYEDPFADYDAADFKMASDEGYDADAIELEGAPSLDDPPPKSYMYSHVTSASENVARLTPLSEKPSFGTMTDPTSSSDSSSHALPLTPGESPVNSRSSYEALGSLRRPSSIIDANPPIMATMRRSDSWWSRFAKSSLLDRAFATESVHSRPQLRPLEFRDPNPPPRLVPIKESSNSLSPEDPQFKRGSRDDPMYASIHHGRSATSLQTSKTADSTEIEKMARTMDIVQTGTGSSHVSHGSTDSGESYGQEARAEQSGSLSVMIPPGLDHITPTAQGFVESPAAINSIEVRRPSPAHRSTAGGNVAARVAAFEQRTLSPSPPSSPLRSKKEHSLYGLAPKQSLFIANPDRRTSSGNS